MGAQSRLRGVERGVDRDAVARGYGVARAIEQLLDLIRDARVERQRRRPFVSRLGEPQAMRASPARQRTRLLGVGRLGRQPDERRGRVHQASFSSASRSASRTLSTCPSTFTLLHTRAILPSGVMRNVERIVPSTSLPYIFFFPHAPYARCASRSGSLSSGKPIPILS